MKFGADKAAWIAQDAAGAGSPVKAGRFCSGAPCKVSRAICLVNDLCFIICEMYLKLDTPEYVNKD